MPLSVLNGAISGLKSAGENPVGITKYDPKNVTVIFGGLPLNSGLAAGTFIEVSRTVDTFKMVPGCEDDIIRVRTNNTSGTYKMTFRKGSTLNPALSIIHTSDEVTGLFVVPMLLVDFNGLTVVGSKQAWIRKYADVTYTTDEPDVVWEFDAADITPFVSGLSGAQS